MSDYVTKTNLLSALGRFKENTDDLYETKADANDLKNALDANTKRIENLEEKAGDYTEVDVKSVYSVPTGKAKNMVLVGVEGVSRVRNQLVDVLSMNNNDGLTYAFDHNGKITITGTTTAGDFRRLVSSTSFATDHKYLCFASTPLPEGYSFGSSYSSEKRQASIETPVISGGVGILYIAYQSGKNCAYDGYINITDLTLYFNGTIPSDADTIAEIQQNYPWLLLPSSYGTSMVKTRYEGFRSYDSSNNLIAEVTLPTPLELGSAGSVAEKAYLNEDGEAWKTNPLISINLGTQAWSTDALPRTGVDLHDVIKSVSNSDVANIICLGYQRVSRSDIDNYDKAICVNTGGYLIIRDTSFTGMTQAQIQTALSGIYADVERITPDADTPLTALTDNLIATEGGGTLEAVKTYPIDDSFTVGYLTL